LEGRSSYGKNTVLPKASDIVLKAKTISQTKNRKGCICIHIIFSKDGTVSVEKMGVTTPSSSVPFCGQHNRTSAPLKFWPILRCVNFDQPQDWLNAKRALASVGL
jgi:hypothetical protein